MQQYTHLTESERYHVYLMKKQQKSLKGIAKSKDRSPQRSAERLNATPARRVIAQTGLWAGWQQTQRGKQTHHKEPAK